MSNNLVSKEHTIPLENGVYTLSANMGMHGNHQLATKVLGSLASGSLIIDALSPGSDVYEEIEGATIDLTAIESVLFSFVVRNYRVTVSGVTGASSGSQIVITDIPLGV